MDPDFFLPLANKCLQLVCFLRAWKDAVVVTLQKLEQSNRSISILAVKKNSQENVDTAYKMAHDTVYQQSLIWLFTTEKHHQMRELGASYDYDTSHKSRADK